MDWLEAGAIVGILLVVAGVCLVIGYRLGRRRGYRDGNYEGYERGYLAGLTKASGGKLPTITVPEWPQLSAAGEKKGG